MSYCSRLRSTAVISIEIEGEEQIFKCNSTSSSDRTQRALAVNRAITVEEYPLLFQLHREPGSIDFSAPYRWRSEHRSGDGIAAACLSRSKSMKTVFLEQNVISRFSTLWDAANMKTASSRWVISPLSVFVERCCLADVRSWVCILRMARVHQLLHSGDPGSAAATTIAIGMDLKRD